MRIVIGVGGNALAEKGQKLDINTQRKAVQRACTAIAPLADEHEIIITHGNGPQVGLLALQATAAEELPPYPFDVLVAESQGMIGYLLAQELLRQLPNKHIVTVLTQVAVAASDPAFSKPTKFIGPFYTEQQMQRLVEQYKWQFSKEDKFFRRVVPSPNPLHILEIDTVKSLCNKETIVICAGGGGIPVTLDAEGHYTGIEAVIDKDLTTALLAEQLAADRLLLLTNVNHVMRDWNTSSAKPIQHINYKELARMEFASGSMNPKVTAVCQFVKNTKKIAHIGSLHEAEQIILQNTGTTISP